MSPHWSCRLLAALLLLISLAAGARAGYSFQRIAWAGARTIRATARAAVAAGRRGGFAAEHRRAAGRRELMVDGPRRAHHRQRPSTAPRISRRCTATSSGATSRSPPSTTSHSASPQNTAATAMCSRARSCRRKNSARAARSSASRSSKAISTGSSGRRAVEIPQLLLVLRGEDHRRAPDQCQDARALSAARGRPSRPEVQEQPEGLAEQAGRRDAGRRGGGEADRLSSAASTIAAPRHAAHTSISPP